VLLTRPPWHRAQKVAQDSITSTSSPLHDRPHIPRRDLDESIYPLEHSLRFIVDLAGCAENAEIECPPGGGVIAVFVLGEVIVGREKSGPDLFANLTRESEEGELRHECECGKL